MTIYIPLNMYTIFTMILASVLMIAYGSYLIVDAIIRSGVIVKGMDMVIEWSLKLKKSYSNLLEHLTYLKYSLEGEGEVTQFVDYNLISARHEYVINKPLPPSKSKPKISARVTVTNIPYLVPKLKKSETVRDIILRRLGYG